MSCYHWYLEIQKPRLILLYTEQRCFSAWGLWLPALGEGLDEEVLPSSIILNCCHSMPVWAWDPSIIASGVVHVQTHINIHGHSTPGMSKGWVPKRFSAATCAAWIKLSPYPKFWSWECKKPFTFLDSKPPNFVFQMNDISFRQNVILLYIQLGPCSRYLPHPTGNVSFLDCLILLSFCSCPCCRFDKAWLWWKRQPKGSTLTIRTMLLEQQERTRKLWRDDWFIN